MFLSNFEVELLKLIGWCKHIPVNISDSFSSKIFLQEHFSLFLELGHIATDKSNKAYRLTPAGYKLLARAGYEFPADTKPRNEEKLIKRRILSALTLITFYRAGIDVFIDNPNRLSDPSVYLPSFALRRDKYQKSSLLNSTIFIGAYKTQETAYLVFNVSDTHNAVHIVNEMETFYGLFGNTDLKNTSIIFMGSSIENIGSVVFDSEVDCNTKGAKTFGEVYRGTSLSVHFIPTNDHGAQILKFMQIENYREVIAKAALGNKYKPRHEDLFYTDTIHPLEPYYPVIMTLDSDIKRIDRALEDSLEKGFEQIAIYVSAKQGPFIKSRYQNRNNAIINLINLDFIKSRLKFDVNLFEPLYEPYSNKDGCCLDICASE